MYYLAILFRMLIFFYYKWKIKKIQFSQVHIDISKHSIIELCLLYTVYV